MNAAADPPPPFGPLAPPFGGTPPARGPKAFAGRLTDAVGRHPARALAVVVSLVLILAWALVYYRGVGPLGPYAAPAPRPGRPSSAPRPFEEKMTSEPDKPRPAAESSSRRPNEIDGLLAAINS